MNVWMRVIHLSMVWVGLSGCAAFSSSPFPQTLEARVTAGLGFPHVVQDPSGHVGQVIKVGGVVLTAKRLMDRTEIVVLQIPLDNDAIPQWDRTQSQGRFIATQQTFLDPATLPKGTRVTVIGEVTGQTAVQVDDDEKPYPVLAIQALKVWPLIPRNGYGYRPYWGPYPFWGSYWWPRGNWGPYWSFPRSSFGKARRGFGGRYRRR
jgi:outer membrane lipoprotein